MEAHDVFLRAAANLTGPGILLLVFYLIYQGHLVTKGRHEEIREDRDFWRSVAMKALNIGEAVVDRRGRPLPGPDNPESDNG